MRFIGDVHGKWERYERITNSCPASIQVGDFGIGFPIHNGELSSQPPSIKGTNHRFLRGNHDNPDFCKKQSQWISDGEVTIIGGTKIFHMGGAWSIDHNFRTPGYDWWYDEELSYQDLSVMIEKFSDTKPEIMVTHDLPWNVIPKLISHFSDFYQSRTQSALEQMFLNHQPNLWVCGHWHCSVDRVIDGTRFKILDELEYFDFDIEE